MRKKTYLKLVQYQTEQAKQHLNEVRSIHSVGNCETRDARSQT